MFYTPFASDLLLLSVCSVSDTVLSMKNLSIFVDSVITPILQTKKQKHRAFT